MCVLCYEFAQEEHWAEAIIASSGEPVRLAPGARYRRLAVLNAVVRPYGLSVSDPGAGRHVVISDQKGSSEVASGLGAFWEVAQKLSSRRIDVLDEDLLVALAPTSDPEG